MRRPLPPVTPAPHGGRLLVATVVLLTMVGCTAQSALPDHATATALPAEAPHGEGTATPDATGGAAGPDPDDPDLRILRFAPGDPVTFETAAADRSWSLAVTGSDDDDLVGVSRVVDPAGTTRYAADLRHEVLLVDELHPRVLADAGAVGLYVAGDPGQPLPAGTWEVRVTGNSGPPAVRVAVRSTSDGPGADPGAPQTLDVQVWSTVDLPDPAGVAEAWRTAMDAVLAPHGIAIGELDVVAAGAAGAPYATLGVDGLADEVHDACTAAAEGTGAPPRSALVVLTGRIGEGVLTAARPGGDHSGVAVHRPDDDIDGFAVSTPGTPVLGPASHACVAVSAREDPSSQGLVALHEILHLAGLTRHTTEREGRHFDRLADTPECPVQEFDTNRDLQVSRIECADRDAANLMFWAAGGTELSPEQAWWVRSHPLLRPGR